MNQEIELLAPAGSYEGLVAAINAGADAVYIGGKKFGARAYADNPESDMLIQGIRYAHLYGKKVYLTINTLMKEKELETELYNYLADYYKAGLDAVIVQDMGVFNFVKKYFPDLAIHASTQTTITGVEGAAFLREQGAKRVVLARELSIEEVKKICNSVPVDIECFVHGAICYCYSGQCLFSSFLGGRSGNRGRCAQPCRLPYKTYDHKKALNKSTELYPLSLKDMMTIDYIPELIQAGITSFKIEGRMKRPEYAAGVVEIYRKYIDLYKKNPKNFKVSNEDKERLLQLYSRSGNSGGYYKQHNGKNMLTLENPAYRSGEESLFQELKEKYSGQGRKHKISGILRVFKGKTLELEVTLNHNTIFTTGALVEQALKQPLSKEKIEQQMKKTGNTCFEFEQLTIEMDADIFIPLKEINELRRRALTELETLLLAPYERKLKETQKEEFTKFKEGVQKNPKNFLKKGMSKPLFHVSVETCEQLESLLFLDAIDAVYLDCSMHSLADKDSYIKNFQHHISQLKKAGKKVYFYLPAIFRENTSRLYRRMEKELCSLEFDGMVVRNYESLNWLREIHYAKEIISDFNLYTFNTRAQDFLKENQVTMTTFPLELNEYELKAINQGNSILTVYGHLPFMTTAQCLNKTFDGCDKKSGKKLTLKDRYQKNFYGKNYCDYCYNIIRNGVPLSLLGSQKSLEHINPDGIRLLFTVESGKEAFRIAKAFSEGDVTQETQLFSEFTRGHLKKGVE